MNSDTSTVVQQEQAQLPETASEHVNSAPVRTVIVDSGSEDIPLRYPRRMRREPIRFKDFVKY